MPAARSPYLSMLFYAGLALVLLAVVALHPALHVSVLFVLTLFIVLSERFYLKIGHITYALSFPLVYGLAFASGYPTAIFVTVGAVLATQLSMRLTIRRVLLAGLAWALALSLADGITAWVGVSFHADMQMWQLAANLILTATAYAVVQGSVHTYTLYRRPKEHRNYRPLWQWLASDLALGLAYGAVMIILADNPKNTGTGLIGTLFFFLPLTAIAIVARLITHLTQAKRKLQTLVTVSQSINEQLDLTMVLSRIAEKAHALIQGESAAVFTVTHDDKLSLQAITTRSTGLDRHVQAATLCLSQALPITLPEEARKHLTQALAVPILVEATPAGILSVVLSPSTAPGESDLHLLSAFAAHASVALKNARYIEEREKRLLLEERNRLAREIHDGLAQTLASVVLRIEWMKKHALEPSPLEEVQSTLQEAVTRVRHSIFSLRPGPYHEHGLTVSLQNLLNEVQASHGVRTHFTVREYRALPPHIVETIYHLVTESARNVIKHAHAANLYIELLLDRHQVILRIRDDGCGFHFGQAMVKAAKNRSFGIELMHTLAEDVGGMLEVVTAIGEGTEITFTVNVEEMSHNDHKTARLSV
ncbi:MAG: histidine kinase [Firmicutes bacterium]|nr:histidine kinase [Bacillota bacterium]